MQVVGEQEDVVGWWRLVHVLRWAKSSENQMMGEIGVREWWPLRGSYVITWYHCIKTGISVPRSQRNNVFR